MAIVLVVYYSAYGHIEAMANAVAEGAREAGAQVDIKRVPELVPQEIAANRTTSSIKLPRSQSRGSCQLRRHHRRRGGSVACRRKWPTSSISPVDYGRAAGGAFTSTATQHGGQETTLFSIITNLLHFGMVIVGLDYVTPGR